MPYNPDAPSRRTAPERGTARAAAFGGGLGRGAARQAAQSQGALAALAGRLNRPAPAPAQAPAPQRPAPVAQATRPDQATARRNAATLTGGLRGLLGRAGQAVAGTLNRLGQAASDRTRTQVAETARRAMNDRTLHPAVRAQMRDVFNRNKAR